MGNIDPSMGYVVNDDGSITRINSTQRQSSRSPNFIPVALSSYQGSPKKALYILVFIAIISLNLSIFPLIHIALETEQSMNRAYEDYEKYQCEGDFRDYKHYREQRIAQSILMAMILALSIGIDCKAVPRLRRTYPDKKKILKGVEYIQSNLLSNHRYPYIMTNNLIGVLSMRKGKIIIPPNYDDIRWVIPEKVFCAERQEKKTFYDINGDILNNVPQSYYNS